MREEIEGKEKRVREAMSESYDKYREREQEKR